jgi:hypothetical protein
MQLSCSDDSLEQLESAEQVLVNFLADFFGTDIAEELVYKRSF